MVSKPNQIDYEKEEGPFWFFTFRNEHKIVTVVIQMFLLFAGFVVIIGVIYVIGLIIIIFLHHVIFDRDPARIPSYVKNSSQFSSDEDEDDDFATMSHTNEDIISTKKPYEAKSQGLAEDDLFGQHRGPSAQKKAQIMDKFMTDLDHTRKIRTIHKETNT